MTEQDQGPVQDEVGQTKEDQGEKQAALKGVRGEMRLAETIQVLLVFVDLHTQKGKDEEKHQLFRLGIVLLQYYVGSHFRFIVI